MCVCLYTCICTRRLHFGVYIFAYMSTEFGWVCMWLRIYTQSLHVFVFIYMYRYTEFTCVGVYICVYVHGVFMDVYTQKSVRAHMCGVRVKM